MNCVADTEKTLALEQEAIDKQNVTIKELMDKAGKALAGEVLKQCPEGLVVVICGKGNNGGDGFVAARCLHERKVSVKVLFLYEATDLSGDALDAYETLPKNVLVSAKNDLSAIAEAEIIVDAIFGFSFKPPLREYEANVIDEINKSRSQVISADVPSGLDATTGEAEENKVVKANRTICFSCYKKGLLTNKGPLYGGQLIATDIGIEPKISDKYKVAEAVDNETALSLMPKRPPLIHKKSVGRVLVISGSKEYTGAPILTSEAAYRAGTGYVTLLVPDKIKDLVQAKITPEVIVQGLASDKSGYISNEEAANVAEISKDYDCIAIGPGLGAVEETFKFVRSLLEKTDTPVVADADALNAIAVKKDVFEKIKTNIVLTPHAAELSRLSGISVDEIERDRFKAVSKIASSKITILLKGRYTLTASKEKIRVNLTSNQGMATAGTGDVLTGIIASLISQGLSPENGAALGAYLHGLAGDICAAELSQYALIATDIIDCIPYAFKTVLSG